LKDVLQEVSLVHVAVEKDLKGNSSAMGIQRVRKEARGKLEEICDRFEAAGIRARAHVYIGDAQEEIEKAAKDFEATLIVLGSSSKTDWVERWLGSTPRKIAEESIYPTLIVPPAKWPE
jgi:nucleotide-binding universal stress UspA family protein